MKMTRLLFTISAVILFVFKGYSACPMRSDECASQKCTHSSTVKKNNHYMTLGGAHIGNDGVNDRLQQLGFSQFSPYGVSLGFGNLRQKKRFLHGSEFEALLWKRKERGNTESMFGAGRVISLVGVSLLPSDQFALYPLAGIGFGITSLKAGAKELPFDSAFATPSQLPPASALYQGTFLIDLGLGFQFSRPMPQKKGRYTIGLRGGYIFDPIDNQRWFRNGTRLTDGPDSDLSGPYLRLTFGKIGHRDCNDCAKREKCPYHKKPCTSQCPRHQKMNR